MHEKSGTYCSRFCSNSRTWTDEDKKKKSEANKKFLETNVHPSKGKSGWKHSDEMKDLKRRKTIEHWDKVGRRTPEDHALKNRVGVHNYRARKLKATCPTANLDLIKKIMQNCPVGYEVDHIISMSNGGKHHEDNLQYLPAMENRRKSNKDKYDESLAIKWQDLLKE
jgi:hypothetical protein